MGEEADYYIDQMMDAWDGHADYPRKSFQQDTGNYMWRQKDGSVIDMHNMSNDHIANAIKICERFNNSGKKAQLEQILRDRFI